MVNPLAHTDAYGTAMWQSHTELAKQTWFPNSGGQFDQSYYFTVPDSMCSRNGHTNNAPYMRGSKKWRNPSDYFRSVTNWSEPTVGEFRQDLFDGHKTLKRNIYDNGWFLSTQTYGLLHNYDGSWDYVGRNKAVTKALNKLADGKANLAESVATYKQTIGLVAEPLIKLYKIAIALKRGQFAKAYRMLRVPKILWDATGLAANGWLAWIYGWRPLMLDIHAGYEFLNNQDPADLIIKVYGKSTRSEQFDYVDVNYRRQGQVEYTSRVGIYAQLDSQLLRNLNQFGLANPLSLIWELTPWSFVVDWALPIGPWIESLSATAGLKYVGGFYSATYLLNSKVSEAETYGGGWYTTGNRPSITVTRKLYAREAMTGFPTALPELKSPISDVHAINAAALARTLLRLK